MSYTSPPPPPPPSCGHLGALSIHNRPMRSGSTCAFITNGVISEKCAFDSFVCFFFCVFSHDKQETEEVVQLQEGGSFVSSRKPLDKIVLYLDVCRDASTHSHTHTHICMHVFFAD